jgi:hypothetical protein
LAQTEPGPPTNLTFQLVFPGPIGATGLEIATIEVDHTGPATPSLLFVTFTTAPPAIVPGQTYTFQGVTHYAALNGNTYAPVNVVGDTVTFLLGDGVAAYGPTADTGSVAAPQPTLTHGPGFQVPPGCTVTLEPVNGSRLNTATCYVAAYSSALGTNAARPIVQGTGDVVVSWPVGNLAEIFASGVPGDGLLIKVQGPGIQ